jgi:hypothetical protein
MQIKLIAWALCIAIGTTARAAEVPDAANINAAKIDGAQVTTIQSWKPLPGEQFEVAGRPAFVIRPEKPAAGNPGRG